MGKKSSSIFGDKRLETAFSELLTSIESRHSVLISQLGKDDAQEAQFGRFINNVKVNPDKMLCHYWKNSSMDFSGKDLLVINDSSTLSFKVTANREQLGPLAGTQTKEGFEMHPSIIVDANKGGCYGLGGIDFFQDERTETDEQKAQKLERRKNAWKIPFEEKETYKWFSSPQKAVANCYGAKSYTLLGDRESDIYELMVRTLSRNWDFVYRNRQNRKVIKQDSKSTLYALIEEWDIAHTYFIDLKATLKRTAHRAKLALKFGDAVIQCPRTKKNTEFPNEVSLYAVEVKEMQETVVGNESPVHWILLTSHPVKNVEDALKIIQWYRWRWIIEQCFRTLKLKGLNIEAAQVRTYHGLKNLSTLALTAALQVMQLVQARDGQSDESMDQVFLPKEQECIKALNTKLEGRTKRSINPHPPMSLAFASWVIARLGGWKGYQNRKPPGPISIINGLNRFYNILEGYYLII